MVLSSRSLIFLILVLDLFLLASSYSVVSFVHYGKLPPYDELFFLILGSWIFTYLIFLDLGFFDIQNIFTRTARLLKKFFVFVSIGAIAILLFNMDQASRAVFLGTILWFVALAFPATYLYTYLISIRKFSPLYNKILIIGADKIGEAMQAFFRMNPYLGKHIGFLDDTRAKSDKLNILGKISDFQEVFDKYHFNEVIITIDLSKEKDIQNLVNLSEYNGVRPSVVANYYSIFSRNFELKNFAGIPIVSIREVPLDSYTLRFWKRIFDVVFASIVLIVLLPIFLIIALAIKFETKGPVFYQPIRIGKHGAQILVYKFRSMRVSNRSEDKLRSTSKNDERITKVGKFIRKYSLDELPQFINVLLGDMSVVGPRPHRVDLDKRFQQTVQSYMVRQYIKPGITGWAQVNGWRGPTETKYQYIARTLHDLWYIEHWNFALDIYIIILTLVGKKTGKNAF